MATGKLLGLWFWGYAADNVTAGDVGHEYDDEAEKQETRQQYIFKSQQIIFTFK